LNTSGDGASTFYLGSPFSTLLMFITSEAVGAALITA